MRMSIKLRPPTTAREDISRKVVEDLGSLCLVDVVVLPLVGAWTATRAVGGHREDACSCFWHCRHVVVTQYGWGQKGGL